ncbi:Ig-like domain-containing protein [Goekera deserti]|uniref:Ig-like domain-containing protein n=1 Tax=Goekera deserti TaxID=2497753 RepID=UPI002E2D4B18|nr:Ig-like domain-containing protein [Goekera deserti]
MRRIAAVFTAGAVLLLAGCQGDTSDGAEAAPSTSSAPAASPAEVSVTPTDGTADVAPTVPLEITVAGGELTSATLTDAAGARIDGAAAPAPEGGDVQLFTPSTPLAYGTTYTFTAVAENADDEPTEAATTFSTVAPGTLSTPSIGPLDGTTVGVGMPIRVYFDEPVADQAAAERNLHVTSSRPTDGVWSWVTSSEVHFRPSTYWPADTQVTLDADLYGVDLGDGVWGEKDRTVSFQVGEKHVSVADAATHTLTVYDSDQVVQTYPMSAGSNENPTHNGAHVVLEKRADITMNSETFGLAVDAPGGYRTDVKWATRISNNGEFVHAAPWSVGQQGSSNVSHGCINLSTERARWFFDFSQPGDVVEVVNSIGGTLSPADGDIYDWAVPWDQWKAGSALQ